MSKPIIHITDLICQYSEESAIVLKAENISFEEGKIYFIVGQSGIGKSTLLEALGLMSKTMFDSDNNVTFYQNDGIEIELKALWQDDNKLNEFRRSNYSFIFQENNLIPHFTATENMILALLLSGEEWDKAIATIKRFMSDLHLDHELLDRKIQRLSGGQRQRLSFIRAISAPFKVLFCDEPTGNLDPVVAHDLMSVLKRQVSIAQGCGIIVSHDIELASTFADEIYIIHPTGETFGRLSPDKRLVRKEDGNLIDASGQAITHPIDYLKLMIA